MNLNPELVSVLNKNGFTTPSEVQSHAIPLVLENKDVFAQAETGSGKTGAFAIPLIHKILEREEKDALYIVLSPTRELAQQTHKVITQFGEPLGVGSACFIGGESFDKQKEAIAKKPNFFVATPGRFIDLIKQKLLKIEKCAGVVFDEADRLFEMGFMKDIEFVIKRVPNDRQMILVSATTHQDVLRMLYRYHSAPVEIKLNTDDLVVDNIDHTVAMMDSKEKMPYLVNFLRKHEDTYAIIFCNTQFMTHLVATWLEKMNFKAQPISGRMQQNKRTRLMDQFREKEITILVCTDVAARGLDIKDVNLVVNYDLPGDSANYVHRIGRTGRAGKDGKAISFCGYEDCEKLEAINEYLGENIPKANIEDSDFATDLCKKPYLDKKTLKTDEQMREGKKSKTKENRKKSKDQKNTESTITKKVAKNGVKKTLTSDTPVESKKKGAGKEDKKMAKKTFNYTSTSESDAISAAVKHFDVVDKALLNTTVVSQGRKKFFFFGSRQTTYQFDVKPIYKRLLLPFLIKLFKNMGLKVYVTVSYREPQVRINYSGEDIEYMLENKFALQHAVEEISRKYLAQKIIIPRNLKFYSRADSKGSPRNNRPTEADIMKLVEAAKSKVLESNQPFKMKSLNSAHRRLVHQAIGDDTRFASSSVGEGRFKQVEISLS